MIKLLIPSAKIVNEDLQTIGKLPPVIYPVNNKIVFDFLLEQYEPVCGEIDVFCYEKAEKVHKRLNKYSSQKLMVIDIPELGDLAHTVYYGLTDEAQQLIINFGDTIVMDNIYQNQPDCFYYSEDYVSDKWTYFNIADGIIDFIHDKKSWSNSFHKEKLFVGVFYISDSAALKKCMEEAFAYKNVNVSSFYQALMLYSRIHPLNAVKTNNWFDIGHADKYYNSKLEVKAREFNHIKIDKHRGILTKSSDNKDKFIDEIRWYLKLPSDIEYVRPRIFKYSTDYMNPMVSMEYYAYHTVHELFLNGDLDVHQWEMVFERIKFIIEDFKRYRVTDENIKTSLESMYLEKTLQRLDKLKKECGFKSFFVKKITVNGVCYKNLTDVCEKLKDLIPKMLYDVKEFNIIHGDLCFANMMINNSLSFVKVIDPRGRFGFYDIYGDSRYELAKLFHSVDGKYDFIIKDLFNIMYDVENAAIEYDIQDKDREFDLYEVFTKVFKAEIGKDLKKIELIEALLFLSMIPLHGESFEHQLAMLGTGLEILNRVADITEEC